MELGIRAGMVVGQSAKQALTGASAWTSIAAARSAAAQTVDELTDKMKNTALSAVDHTVGKHIDAAVGVFDDRRHIIQIQVNLAVNKQPDDAAVFNQIFAKWDSCLKAPLSEGEKAMPHVKQQLNALYINVVMLQVLVNAISARKVTDSTLATMLTELVTEFTSEVKPLVATAQ